MEEGGKEKYYIGIKKERKKGLVWKDYKNVIAHEFTSKV